VAEAATPAIATLLKKDLRFICISPIQLVDGYDVVNLYGSPSEISISDSKIHFNILLGGY
jgi:hypothetical protein